MAARIIPPDDSRTVSEKRIEQDQNAVQAWLAANSPVKIDGSGVWQRDGKTIKKRDMPEQKMPSPFERWGSKK